MRQRIQNEKRVAESPPEHPLSGAENVPELRHFIAVRRQVQRAHIPLWQGEAALSVRNLRRVVRKQGNTEGAHE